MKQIDKKVQTQLDWLSYIAQIKRQGGTILGVATENKHTHKLNFCKWKT